MNYRTSREQGPTRVPGDPIQLLTGIRRQYRQILSEGPTAITRKLRILTKWIPEIPAALFGLAIVLLVRLLRPIIVIRFGPIRAANFGHFASEPEIYLSKRDVGLDDPRTFDIQYYSNKHQKLPISNYQLKKMWDRTIRINRLARWPDWINRSIPGGKPHMVPPGNTRDIYATLTDTQPHIQFTDEEHFLGQQGLSALGIEVDTPYIGFHSRDSAWLQQLAPDLDFSYHNHRDSDIATYIPAVTELANKGYYAIRMGSVVENKLNCSNPRIIDYATNGFRTDFLDIYLGAHCKFFIGSAAGITELPKVFRKPILSVNQIPLEYTHSWSPNDIFIPKKLWLRSERRLLTFREILERGLGANLDGKIYEENGIDIIDNSAEEIIDAVLEMEAKIRGVWQPNSEDEELQLQFWSTFEDMPIHFRGGEPLHGVIASKIGAKFLRENQPLLR